MATPFYFHAAGWASTLSTSDRGTRSSRTLARRILGASENRPHRRARPRTNGAGGPLVEQYLDFAGGLTDLYAIIAEGAVVARGKPGDLKVEALRHYLTV